MGPIKAAAADAAITFLWVFSVPSVGVLTPIISSAFNVEGSVYSLLIITTLICLLLIAVNLIAAAIGGASFNPTATAAFYAAGIGKDSLFSLALRFPAQAVGAVGGAMAILELMPPQYKHKLNGPSLKVDLHSGAIAEGLLTFTITFIVLLILFKGPRNPILKTMMISVSTVAMVIAGSGYTGPAMNPANAFGWAYINKRHNTWEQFYVYWICPFVGAILAAWGFRFLFPLPSAKVKKA